DLSTLNTSLSPSNITHISTHPSPWISYRPFNHHTPHHEPVPIPISTSPPSFCGAQHLTHQPQAPFHYSTPPPQLPCLDIGFPKNQNPSPPLRPQISTNYKIQVLAPILESEGEIEKSRELTENFPLISDFSPFLPKLEISNFKNHNTTLTVTNDFSAVKTGEKFNEFITSEESSVTTQLKEEEATPILKTTVATEIVEDNVFTISETDEKSANATTRFAHDSLN
ncbi:hypothetical protein A2U01_0035022, partial [Trifolium medium]|nr:hypothetical protein [Trifolium medium]